MATEILVVRQNDLFSSILTARGFLIVNLPLIKTERLADLSELENHLKNLESFDGIFITSARAAEIFLSQAQSRVKSFGGKFYVLGKRSAELLEAAGGEIFFSDKAKTAEQLLNSIPTERLAGKKFLFVRGSRSLRVVPEMLEGVAEVREAIVYRTSALETDEKKLIEIKKKLTLGDVRAICFFSPSGAEEFLKRFENFTQGKIKIAAIGKTTARFIEANDLRVDFTPAKPTAKDFASELIEFLKA